MVPRRFAQLRLDVGRRVAELRKAKQLTQEQLAERLKVSTRYLQNIEGGRENLTLETMVTLGRKLGVDAHELLVEPASRSPVAKGRPPRSDER